MRIRYGNERACSHNNRSRPHAHRRRRRESGLSLLRILHRANSKPAHASCLCAAQEFFDWLEGRGITQITAIQSVYVAAYIEELTRERSAPTAELRLAALRHLFDWMVIGQIMPVNPAAAVCGPRHIVRRGKTPVLDPFHYGDMIPIASLSRPCYPFPHSPPLPHRPPRYTPPRHPAWQPAAKAFSGAW